MSIRNYWCDAKVWSWELPCDSTVKNLPAMQEIQEMWARSLGQEDTLGEGMVILSSILAGKSHGQRSLVGYVSWGHKELDMAKVTE